jgi:DNA (cytosine-5)-methyltransferase 1
MPQQQLALNLNTAASTITPFTFIDLFAGIGGFRLAVESTLGGTCVFSSEWNVQAQQTYALNFGEQPFGDITQIPSAQIPSHTLLCAGFPCQAFSISGKQKGFEDTRGTLFFDVARIAQYHQSEFLFLENVKNFVQHNQGKTLATVLKTLDDIGYIPYYQVLNASDFGLPQKRERFYLIAIRKDLGTTPFVFPVPPKVPVALKDVLLPDAETVAYRIHRSDITLKSDVTLHRNLFGVYPLVPKRIGTVNKGGQGERIYHENGHAITLSAHGGGIGAKTGLYLINGHIRKLAPRECARLQGFPDDFKLADSDAQAYQQLGNSVPVTVLKSILQALQQWREQNVPTLQRSSATRFANG